MFKKLAFKQRLKYFPFAFLIALLIVYRFAISETIKIYLESIELLNQTNTASEAPNQIAIIQKKLSDMNNIMGKESKETDSDPLLGFFTSLKLNNSINLVDFQSLHVVENKNYRIETRVAVFEGSYNNLLKFLYKLEKQFKYGKVISVDYSIDTNFNTKKKRLLMKLYIQSIKKANVHSDVNTFE